MKNWKIQFRYGGIESSLEYLEKMAAKGWMIEFWQDLAMVFTRSEPRKIRFAMDELVSGKWDIGAVENEPIIQDYVSMYEEMGWHYVSHQETTFLFYTEDESLPLPQTDPVAFKNSIHKKHRRVFIVSLIMVLAELIAGKLLYENLYDMAASSHQLWTGVVYLLLGVMAIVLFLMSFVQWNRERKALRLGKVPKIQGYEGCARMLTVIVVLAYISAAVANVVGSKGTSMVGWALLSALTAMFFAVQVIPPILYGKGRMTKGEALRWVRRCNKILVMICIILFSNSLSGTHKVDTQVDPQTYPPIITLEEWSGIKGTTVHYTEDTLFSKMYTYYEYGEGDTISYDLYVSDQKWLLQSFEHSGRGSGFYQERVDWDTAVTPLDHEVLGLTKAWYYEKKIYSGSEYHYYLQSEHAAMGLEVDEELSQEWLQQLSERLAAVK